MDIITGKTGEAHITSTDVGHIYASVFGNGQYVLPLGTQFEIDTSVAGSVTVRSGDACINGRVGRIRDNLSETLSIDNGQTGHTRCDWLVIRYTKSDGVENMELIILKGATDSTLSDTPSDYREGDIIELDTTVDFLLYKLMIQGVNEPIPYKMFEVVSDLDSLLTGATPTQYYPEGSISEGGGIRTIESVLIALRNMIYPVGSIYMSTSNTSPATLFGGSWTKIQGRFLAAIGDNGASGAEAWNLSISTDADLTGGEKTHTLDLTEIPAHKHTIHERNNSGSGSSAAYSTATGKASDSTTRTGSVGGGAAHNNLPPYYAVHMWRRTA